MRQILFHIPREAFGQPVFGFGWLLAIWAIASAAALAVELKRHGASGAWGYVPSLALAGAAIYFAPNLMDNVGLPIRGYGVMLLVSIVASVGLAVYRARQVGLNPDLIYELAMWFFILGIIGARLFYVIQFWGDFNKPSLADTIKGILNFTQGGLVVYGSVLGGALALILFVRKHKLPGLALADLIAPSVILGMGLGRFACFFTGCCWGGPCDLPWAVTFPWGSPPHVEQAEKGLLALQGMTFEMDPSVAKLKSVEPGSPAEQAGMKAGDTIVGIALPDPTAHLASDERQVKMYPIKDIARDNFRKVVIDSLEQQIHPGEEIILKVAGEPEPRHWTLAESPERSRGIHPTQLYSAADGILLCLVLWAYTPFRRRDGELCALFFTLHPISRFVLESLRREPTVFGTNLSIGQTISIVVLVLSIAIWGYVLSRPRGLAWTYHKA